MQNGVRCLCIDGTQGSALVYVHGAHVAEWRPAGHAPVLWLSGAAIYQPGKAIRGGIPICFPWFGAHPRRPELGAHGFARTRDWAYLGSALTHDGAPQLEFSLADDTATRQLWPHAFLARYRVTFGRELGLELTVTNRGHGPLRFEAALHTYFAISDIQSVSVSGLKGAHYVDHVRGNTEAAEQAATLSFAGEFDRMYSSTATTLLSDPGLERTIRVDKQSSANTIVWNPWAEKAARLADLEGEQWRRMPGTTPSAYYPRLSIPFARLSASRTRPSPRVLDAG
jgi:D-hexose-6-phosphate mutarotase